MTAGIDLASYYQIFESVNLAVDDAKWLEKYKLVLYIDSYGLKTRTELQWDKPITDTGSLTVNSPAISLYGLNHVSLEISNPQVLLVLSCEQGNAGYFEVSCYLEEL